MVRRSIAPVMVGLLVFLGGLQTGCQQDVAPKITVQELHTLAESGQPMFLLDVRTEPEYLAERLSFTSQRITLDSLTENLHLLPADKDTTIYTFCHSGRRSRIAAGLLKRAGYTHVFNVDGGIIAWKRAGYETASGR